MTKSGNFARDEIFCNCSFCWKSMTVAILCLECGWPGGAKAWQGIGYWIRKIVSRTMCNMTGSMLLATERSWPNMSVSTLLSLCSWERGLRWLLWWLWYCTDVLENDDLDPRDSNLTKTLKDRGMEPVAILWNQLASVSCHPIGPTASTAQLITDPCFVASETTQKGSQCS